MTSHPFIDSKNSYLVFILQAECCVLWDSRQGRQNSRQIRSSRAHETTAAEQAHGVLMAVGRGGRTKGDRDCAAAGGVAILSRLLSIIRHLSRDLKGCLARGKRRSSAPRWRSLACSRNSLSIGRKVSPAKGGGLWGQRGHREGGQKMWALWVLLQDGKHWTVFCLFCFINFFFYCKIYKTSYLSF